MVILKLMVVMVLMEYQIEDLEVDRDGARLLNRSDLKIIQSMDSTELVVFVDELGGLQIGNVLVQSSYDTEMYVLMDDVL